MRRFDPTVRFLNVNFDPDENLPNSGSLSESGIILHREVDYFCEWPLLGREREHHCSRSVTVSGWFRTGLLEASSVLSDGTRKC